MYKLNQKHFYLFLVNRYKSLDVKTFINRINVRGAICFSDSTEGEVMDIFEVQGKLRKKIYPKRLYLEDFFREIKERFNLKGKSYET